MARVYRTDREWPVPLPPDAVWSGIADLAAYRARWPWLRRFDARALESGDTWRCTVKPPLPYSLSFAIHLVAVDDGRTVTARLDGDITGPAEVHLAGDGDGASLVRLVSALTPAHPLLRTMATVAPVVAQWGHDRVLEVGVRQFAASVSAPPG